MHCTEFADLYSSASWSASDVTWSELVERLSKFEIRPAYNDEHKKSVSLWAPIKLKPGTKRRAENVLEVHAAVLDLDEHNEESVTEILGRLCEDNVAFVCHSTLGHLHDGKTWKVRVVMPLAEPVMGRAWLPVWRAIAQKYAPGTDRQCKDASRQYYVPAHVEGVEPFLITNDGEALAAPQLKQAAAQAPVDGNLPLTESIARRISKSWRASSDAETILMGDVLLSAIEGVALAPVGSQDTTIFKLIGRLVRHEPKLSAGSVYDLLKLSLDIMAQESGKGEWDRANIVSKVERCRADLITLGAEKEVQAASQEAERIQRAFGTGRTTPYSDEEMSDFAATLGISPSRLQDCWILQYLNSYYVLSPGCKFMFANRESLRNTARHRLAPSPVPLYKISEKGEQPTPVAELLEDYSTPLQSVHKSLIHQAPAVDLENYTLTLPTCPRRDLEPEYNEEVALWLELLGGDQHDILLDWLSLFPDLSSPISALVLIGEGSGGKSLLIRGLSRIWTTGGATKLEDALGNFNAALETCPLAVADESLPKDARGRVMSDKIREFVQSTQRQSNEKYKAVSTLIGAARLIIAANNDQILDFREGLTPADIGAISERFFHIRVNSEPGELLKALGDRQYLNPNWIDTDAIAKHVLWLEQNHKAVISGRFGTRHDSKLFSEKLAVRERARAGLCEWLTKYAFDPAPLRATGKNLQAVESCIMVHVATIVDNWGLYIKNGSPPSTAVAAAALQALSLGSVSADSGLSLQAVDPGMLSAWAAHNGYCDPDALAEKLSQLDQ